MTTVTLPRATVEQALEALKYFRDTAVCSADTDTANEVIPNLEAALAQQAEPAKTFLITGNEFCGAPPAPYATWGDALAGMLDAGKIEGLRISALRAALAEPVQEPVAHFGSAYVNENGVHITTVLGPVAIPQDAKLYTAPPPRKPLTEEEIPALAEQVLKPSVYCDAEALLGTDGLVALVRAVERAHGIKE